MAHDRESPSTPSFRSYSARIFPYPDSMLPPRAEIRVMLERSNEDHSGFREVEVSQKRAEGSRRALTREKNRILLSSSHRVSDDVSGFVSVTIVSRQDTSIRPSVTINDRKVANAFLDNIYRSRFPLSIVRGRIVNGTAFIAATIYLSNVDSRKGHLFFLCTR